MKKNIVVKTKEKKIKYIKGGFVGEYLWVVVKHLNDNQIRYSGLCAPRELFK